MSASSRRSRLPTADVPSIDTMDGNDRSNMCRKKGLKILLASSIVATILLFVFCGLFVNVSRRLYGQKEFVEVREEFTAFKMPAVTVCHVRPFASPLVFDAQRQKQFDFYDTSIAWANESSQIFGPVELRWQLPGEVAESRARFDAANATRLPANDSSRSLLPSSDQRAGFEFEFELCRTAKFDDDSMQATARRAAAAASSGTRSTVLASFPTMPEKVRNFTIQLTAVPRPATRPAFAPRTIVFVHDPDEKPSMLFHSRLGRKIPHAFLRDQNVHSVQVEVVTGKLIKVKSGKCKDDGSQFEDQRELLAKKVAKTLECTPQWFPDLNEEDAEFPFCATRTEGDVTKSGYNQILYSMNTDMLPLVKAATSQPTLPSIFEGADSVEDSCLDGFGYQNCEVEDEVPPRCSFWVYHVAFMFDGQMMGTFQQG